MNRRDFLRDTAATSMALAMGFGVVKELRADPEPRPDDTPKGPPVNCAVIGLGAQGKEILTSLAKLGNALAPVPVICDTFTAPVFVKKATDIVPNATFVDDYRKVLDNKSVQAVFVATPTHKHKQIVLDALAAGKHVYCEAPLAVDLGEAREIAKAGLDAKPFFMAGLQLRSNMQNLHVLKFFRSGALGQVAYGRGQWHDRNSWRKTHPTPEREQELNWRLSKATSNGLLGEVGLHQIDSASWFFNKAPVSVTGYGAVMGWNDGRDMPDTAQCIVEYPKNVRFIYDATLTNSYEGAYEMYYGTASAIQMRDQRAWMFKEGDANDLGWETFARKDDVSIGDPKAGTGVRISVGIALVADASKQLALGKDPGKVGTDVSKTSLYQSVDAFVTAVRENKKPSVGPQEGYQATVIGAKCNEAVLTGSKITFQPDMFTLS